MIDRKKGPEIQTDFDLELKGVQARKLPNGLEFHESNSGTQHIIKIELVFRTGRIHERQRAVAKAALSLIREGSTRHKADELAEIFDFYGAVVKSTAGMEVSTVSLVVVERYFEKVWPVWLHMVFYPLYAEAEIDKYRQVTASKFVNQLAKNDVQGYRKLTEEIFGADHPYGYNTQVADIQALTRDKILGYYNENFGLDTALVVLSGRYKEPTRDRIRADLGAKKRQHKSPEPTFPKKPVFHKTFSIKTDNEVQVSIKSGRRLFDRRHPDFTSVSFLNAILGGYFGSRLMRNIREDKGYTYGIYSALHGWTEDGFLYISADVANAHVEATLTEIHKEMRILREELVPSKELEMVRNYLLGQSLHLLDGPFAKGELVKNLISKNRTLEDFNKAIVKFKTIQAAELREMAQRYLTEESFVTVLTGSLK